MKINLYLILVVTFFFQNVSFAQSDDPCGATALTLGTTCITSTYTNATGTASSGIPAPGCANYVGGDVWFSVIVPASGNVSFDSNTGVITDAGMAIYSGTCSALTLVECDDDDSVNGLMPSINSTGLAAGSTIWIRFWEFGGDNNGTFDICVYDPSINSPPPPNDEPCSATPVVLGTSCNFSTFTTSNATNSSITQSVSLPSCANYNGADVWFSVTVPASGHLIFDSDIGQITDGGMSIYSGTCNALTEIECDDDDSGNGAMSFIDRTGLVAGGTIWIRFWEYGGVNNGTFDICVYDGGSITPCTGGSGSNLCPDQVAICTDNTYCYSAGIGITAVAGNDYGCLSTQPNPSWYYFEIATAGNLIFDISAASDIDFAVWGPFTNTNVANASCGSLSAPIDCSFSTLSTEQVNLTNVAVGEIYILIVTNYASIEQDINLNIAAGSTATSNCAIVGCNADAGSW